jgi:hypothetical protein
MSAHQVAQSVPERFSGIMAPELAVGSPERAAYFAKLRPTFVEDWKAAEEAVAAQRAAKGDLYFIRAGKAVKIGHTHNIVARLGNMQANNPQELDCLLLLRGKGHEERDWHKRFKAEHIRGEWFRLSPRIKRAIEKERGQCCHPVL